MASIIFVDFGNYRVANALKLLEVFLKVFFISIVITIYPFLSLLKGIKNLLFIVFVNFVGQLFLVLDSITHLIQVVLELVSGVDFIFE